MPIDIRDYDPRWPEAFKSARNLLAGHLDGMVTDIEHIGSTSIPGMPAKPKIDIDIVLSDINHLQDCIDRLTERGYSYHGDPYDDGMWTFTRKGRGVGERVYLCAPGTAAHQKRLFFRDHLREYRADADTYAALKKRLTIEARGDWDRYSTEKGPFIRSIVARAAARHIQSVTRNRSQTTREVLGDLPEWFGIPEATASYVEEADTMPMFACQAPDGLAVGFLSLKATSDQAIELYVMGVKRGWHRMGLGQALIDKASRYALGQGAAFLTVKTIAASHPDENYAATRAFYERVGFRAIEVFPTLWGPSNPCLFMIKVLEPGEKAKRT